MAVQSLDEKGICTVFSTFIHLQCAHVNGAVHE